MKENLNKINNLPETKFRYTDDLLTLNNPNYQQETCNMILCLALSPGCYLIREGEGKKAAWYSLQG